MLKGICPKCGKVYYGLMLGISKEQYQDPAMPDKRYCGVCGSKLLIYNEDLEKTEEGREEIAAKMKALIHEND